MLFAVALSPLGVGQAGAEPEPEPAVEPGCPQTEVIFARGTDQAPGPGDVGQLFINAFQARTAGIASDVYSVNYPASQQYSLAIDGVVDARNRLLDMANRCPDTQLVLGGFSQGAAVIGYLTADKVPPGVTLPDGVDGPLPNAIADHVAAVVLFGKPDKDFLTSFAGGAPEIIIGEPFKAKTLELCAPGDFVCSDGGDLFAHTTYPFNGMIDQAADFAVPRVRAGLGIDGEPAAPSADAAPPADVAAQAPEGTPHGVN
ncbi:cutinase family protein [Mycolicibacterium brumae]|nr:cutinase family protein [Mycolicibacterium brumae]RWA23396.1 hypothetical protein MBRU_00835 [Mycolicibacterium brumae DSM 44177]UWW08672.1 cutinase family protein [Mycolicibacterium brumae]